MKKILGLDLGTNSIGWALIAQDFENRTGKIISMGSRIIPMSQDVLGKFDSGVSISQTAERTGFRGTRRLRERHLLRRARLHTVLLQLGFLPGHYASQIDFEKRVGQFLHEKEPKLAWRQTAAVDFEFIFQNSFQEMVGDFQKANPALFYKKANGSETKIPYDWTIFYLRKKALTQKIEKEELAWLLLNFNQKRGYYQLRGEEEETLPNKLVEFHSLMVTDVTVDGPANAKGETWHNVILENGWIYRRSSKIPLFDWKGKTKEFVVTTELNDDGSVKTDKDGKEKRSFRAPEENDWTLVKTKTEQTIAQSGKTVGAYIYDALLENPKQKIKGKLVRTIERKFYKEELRQILETQQKFHSELQDTQRYQSCIELLYTHNEAHRNNIANRDFVHLFLDDIIFYQRPLKSKISQISDCRFETKKGIDGVQYPVKCIAKSHPLFQEFRLWQWLQNLHIYNRDQDHTAVTSDFLGNEEDYVALFEFLNERKDISQDALLRYLLERKGFKGKALTNEIAQYRWNYVDDKEKRYPCNETRNYFLTRLAQCAHVPSGFLTAEREEALWHILYSVSDKIEIEKALKTFALKNGLGEDFVAAFRKTKPYETRYGSYSAKAIKKMLPLMRMGKYWNAAAIHPDTLQRIEKLITGEYDERIRLRVREKAIHLSDVNHFKGLPLWLVSYIVYDRHSEEGDLGKWETPVELESFLKAFKQHSLRNPIVEQVITETLRLVNDVWKIYGAGQKGYFDEIHVELGREMKNPADKRRELTNKNSEQENTNARIRALLMELHNDELTENVRPYSPMQQELLKIYEDGVLKSSIEIPDDILKISKAANPSRGDLLKYKLWLEQKYCSPYTGRVIPLSKLFTPDYEIEHIIPQSRYFDDSFSNKVICEAEVNKLKDNSLAMEFIEQYGGQMVDLKFGGSVPLLSVSAYKDFIKDHYAKNYTKRKKLELVDIPDKMVERQMNDTRYISKEVKNLLSKIVRSEKDDDGTTSKNVISGNGQITAILRQDWGLNDIWNEIIAPRFERLNEMTGNDGKFGFVNPNTGKFLPQVPSDLQKGFSKKRIDHRHHALDALIIACATRDHVNLLNNMYAKSEMRYDLQRKLRAFEKVSYTDKNNRPVIKEIPKHFLKPWDTFTQDARTQLQTIVISFKKNQRVINKTVNRYDRWVAADGKLEKKKLRQEKGDSWAIRKSMHKDTVSGRVQLRFTKTVSLTNALDAVDSIVDKALKKHIKELQRQGYDKKKLLKYFKELNNSWQGRDIAKTEVYYFVENAASRVKLDDTFNTSKIESITDSGIRKILIRHLEAYNTADGKEQPELAFSPEGIDELNKNIRALNDGKFHQPIFKVRTYEPMGNKFAVGETGNKKAKFVEAAKGTNLFFAIYADESGKRTYETIPLNIVIERQKQGQRSVPEISEKGSRLLFYLSPNDLVYLPDEEEKQSGVAVLEAIDKKQALQIYKMVSASGSQCFFIRHDIATPIVNKFEFSPLNKMEKSIDGIMIKEACWKLEVDRLGNIMAINGKRLGISSRAAQLNIVS